MRALRRYEIGIDALRHRAEDRELLVDIVEVRHDLEHATAGGPDRAGDADELVRARRQRRGQLAATGAMVECPRRGESERTVLDRLPRELGHGRDVGTGRERLVTRTRDHEHAQIHVQIERCDRAAELAKCAGIEGIARRRSVESQDTNRPHTLELAAGDARSSPPGGNADMEGGLANRGITASPWRPFFSVASVIALINSMVAGALAGVALDGVAPRSISVIAALAVVAIAIAAHYRLGSGRFVRALERFTPIFPTGVTKAIPR